MKTLNLLKRIALLSLAGAALAGCNEDVETSFSIYSQGGVYILQTNSGTGEGLEKSFAPYIGLGAAYGTFADVTITHNGMPVYGRMLGPYFYETDAYSSEHTLSAVNGTYAITAVGTREDGTQQTATGSVTFSMEEDDALGELKVKEFSVDGSRVKASWEKVDNATAAGIIISVRETPPGYTEGFYRLGYNMTYLQNDYISTNECSVHLDLSAYPEGQEFEIKVAALNSVYGKGSILLEGPTKTIVKGTNHFIEDPEE